ncbi:hypothetical protein NP233_g6432 [Leucocoprinus birnbaumii]|uniref:Uncharacterized protein n=1 Tax=Leucocoprinus birnbaumii TaxID=56174 RepID=A0AAD5VS85_9AGAR|nr:hypothetical protein NP233_g6432 [Leucocoprinus birnbaumii]
MAASTTAAAPVKSSDPGLEKRVAARLALEAQRAQEQQRQPSQQRLGNENRLVSGPPRPSGSNPGRPRNPSGHDRGSSGPARGTERSRRESPKSGAAEAIMAFNQPNKQQPGAVVSRRHADADDGNTLALEPVFTNMKALLDTVPSLSSSLPPLPTPRQLRHTPAAQVKRVYGGDYSQWQVDSQSYLKGALGLRSTYAKIVLDRNPTIIAKPQNDLIAAIRRLAREA